MKNILFIPFLFLGLLSLSSQNTIVEGAGEELQLDATGTDIWQSFTHSGVYKAFLWATGNNFNFGTYIGDVILVTNSTGKVWFKASGDVGIGTGTPGAKLEVQFTGTNGILIDGNDTGDARLQIENGGGNHYIFDDDSDGHSLDIESAGEINFNTGGANERLSIRSNGDLNFANDRIIFLNHATNGRINVNSSSHDYQFSAEGTTFTVRDDLTYKFGYYGPDEFGPTANNNMTLGSSTYRWMEIWSNNPLNTASDRRLKKNIKPTQFGLKEVLQLEPVEYNWKVGHDKTMIGLIAQDVENVVPHVVSHNVLTDAEIERIESEGGGRTVSESDKDNYSMSYSQLIPVLIKAIQEQQVLLEQQKILVEQLQSRIKKLEDD